MGRGYGDWYDRWHPPSKPRPVRGGIKARTRRGEFGASWWAKRWQEVLMSVCSASRLSRGRAYARGGQVLSIDIHEGLVEAKVQGSRARPYAVSIEVETLPEKHRRKLARALSRRALFAAKLLAGQIPAQIEEAFQQAGLSLFPHPEEIWTTCSCPDWDNPCKHIAAVYCLLGEEFDRDPFLLLELRGIGREELVEMVGGAGSSGRGAAERSVHGTTGAANGMETVRPAADHGGPDGKSMSAAGEPPPPAADGTPDVELLPEDVEGFWRGRRPERGRAAGGSGEADGDEADRRLSSSFWALGAKVSPGSAAEPSTSARAVLASLGRPRFWRGEEDLEEVLVAACDAAAELAVAVLGREGGGSEGGDKGDGEETVGQGNDGPPSRRSRAATGRSPRPARKAHRRHPK